MHQLFSQVLGQRDLSRAGDLFSLEDTDIEDCLSQALDQIKDISCSPDYLTNDNDQAVVEICITRITTAIRETGSIEKHSRALVGLWESCLEHNLTPQGENTEDTPHAKIASDITSCILQNYSCPSVMVLAVPVAVRFLQRGNRGLSRNMSSYLSLAAIAKVDLLAEHAEAITLSVLGGNHMLLRVLPSVYPKQPDTIHHHLSKLTAKMTQLESAEKPHLICLIQMIADQHPLTHAHSSLIYLVSLLGSMEHCFHHTLLLEIKALTDRYPSLLGGSGKDIYRMSNSFAAIARLLARRLEENTAAHSRLETLGVDEAGPSLSAGSRGGGGGATEQLLQVKIQGFDEKMGAEEEEEVGDESPAPQRRYSLTQAIREERREMRFNRSKSLALHAVRSCSIDSDTAEDGEGAEQTTDSCFPNTLSYQLSENCEVSPSERKPTGDGSLPVAAPPNADARKEAACAPTGGMNGRKEEGEEDDKVFVHFKDNMETIREFCRDMVRQIPVPEHCVIEDSHRGCVAKLSFSCPLKGFYCLYAKSCFNLTSQQPHLWIHVMLLHLQSKSSVPLSTRDKCVQRLSSLWEKTQLKGSHSFSMAMTQHTTPQRKDLDILQMQLEEVRFFDLFGYSEEEGSWLCFMCNNPEKATVVNQEGQPLIEGKLKEKQVRWKFIKRWKTRYFTLAGNQLLFRRGKSKDELDDIPIELSKVQSVKVVAKKRRDRGLPRAFEIFTDSKTYVLKAEDEKHAEEWLQCINVAVAQARERENREATTYL
ncbi:ventricular zone-expressed PH domain-containing protein isoform X3 [Austrofundulus limnaeus]|uniref:Ventricular zone-expressed PH domain-containing protein isoform X3 n=1 Tax=Austrofundulus limnaeus TaxID=52670 RepID=A0A2I4BKK9_AUSLI|nr:PREDICTED: ventricular zone-expressed PH domain-containing protein homolog 1 isoform X3 [Austrofundulus limnaeus]